MSKTQDIIEENEIEEWQKLEIMGQVVELNSTRTVTPTFIATSLRTNDLKYRSISLDLRVAETFLVNSRLLRNEQESASSMLNYFEDSVTKMLSLPRGAAPASKKRIELPKRLELNTPLGDVLISRKSVRQFTGDDLPLDFLATILFSAGGITHKADTTLRTGEKIELKFRSAPSGGGLYPIDMAVVVNHVRGLNRGVYQYDGNKQFLAPWLGSDAVDNILTTMAFPEEILSAQRASVILLLIARPWRSMRKYGARGMRMVFMESGYISQNVHLTTSALGFGSVDCAGMYDDELNDFLKIDGVYTTAIHSILIGCPE